MLLECLLCLCVCGGVFLKFVSKYMSVRQPECVGGNKASAELKGFVQRAWHFLAGLVVRAHVLDAGHQLVEPLPQEHLGPWALRRWAARAVRAHPRALREQVHLWKEALPKSSCVVYPPGSGRTFKNNSIQQINADSVLEANLKGGNTFGSSSP